MGVVGDGGVRGIAGVWNVYATCDHSGNKHASEVHACLSDPPQGLKRGASESNGGGNSVWCIRSLAEEICQRSIKCP